MSADGVIQLTRDCQAVRIPDGDTVVLNEGLEVVLIQDLGGTYTVRADAGLFRLRSQDGDALGLENAQGADQAASGPLSEGMVWETLKTCFDPEIPVNIVDLGLVYDMGIEDLPSGEKKVFVKMTLTAPGCGMGTVIAGDAQDKILNLPEVGDASVEIVWDPPWHQSMITSDGKKVLGLE